MNPISKLFQSTRAPAALGSTWLTHGDAELLSTRPLRFTTQQTEWAYAVSSTFASMRPVIVKIHATVPVGAVGAGVVASDHSTYLSGEPCLAESTAPQTFAFFVEGPVANGWLVLRNRSASGASSCTVHAIEFIDPGNATNYEAEPPPVPDDDVAREATEIERIAFRSLDDAKCYANGQVLLSRRDLKVPHDTMWRPADAPILAATNEIIQLLPFYGEDALADHNVTGLDEAYFRKYLRQTNVRVANLADVLRARMQPGARILEIGSFFGSFSLSLQRLGYQVTAVDRYDEYRDRFLKHIGLMRRSGVHVVSTSRANELDIIVRLGKFDAVIAMAVIEHVPHTPKPFLEMLKTMTKPCGQIAIDTPNLTRFWTRKWLTHGKTIFQRLEDQFECTPPWEGHHREYTGDELVWMLDRIGCEDIVVKRFDYNMLQFDVIDASHIECLEQCINDHSIGDTILAVGSLRG
jgi:2-polyprenyl-3-methyl-5-hydroxy-6-metoxy-1,4-benzoquinol methylase